MVNGNFDLGQHAPVRDELANATGELLKTVPPSGGFSQLDGITTALDTIAGAAATPKKLTAMLIEPVNALLPAMEVIPNLSGVLSLEKPETTKKAVISMPSKYDNASRMTNLILEIPHSSRFTNPAVFLHLPETPVATIPTALLTPPADAAPPRLDNRDDRPKIQPLKLRRGPTGLTVIPGSSTPPSASMESELPRKRTLRAEATPPTTQMDASKHSDGTGAEHEPMKKRPPTEIKTENTEKTENLFKEFLASKVRTSCDLFAVKTC